MDANSSGVIENATEETLFFSAPSVAANCPGYPYPSGTTMWEAMIRKEDGALFVCDIQAPDRLMMYLDGNSDGDALDCGEQVAVYDQTVSPHMISYLRGAAFLRAPELVALPNPIARGNQTSIAVVSGGENHFATIYMAIAPISFPLVPLGVLELQPPLWAIAAGTTNSRGTFSLAAPIPGYAVPGNYYLQALAGDLSRPYLSNLLTLVITP
jgi:hypothetical protein